MRKCLFIALLAALCTGCGLATYEERLKETADYFAYHQMLNENLTKQPWSGSILTQAANQDQQGGQPQWVSVPIGITMRVPLGFTRIPGPQLSPDESTEDPDDFLPPNPEDRHPTFLNPDFQLPGIVDSWEMATESGQGRIRLYVVGNHDRLLAQQTDAESVDPGAFYSDLEAWIELGMGVGLVKDTPGTPTDNNVFYEQRFPNAPGRERFQLQKDFDAVNIVPPQQIEGVEYRAQLYEVYKAEDVHVKVAVLCIFPANEYSNVVEKLELALETLTVSDQSPSRPDESGGGGGF